MLPGLQAIAKFGVNANFYRIDSAIPVYSLNNIYYTLIIK